MVKVPSDCEMNLAFIEILRSERDALNKRFALRLRGGQKIDAAAFQHHLRTTVNSLVSQVAEVQPERVRAVTNGLFDVSLDLFAADLIGPVLRHPYVSQAWQQVLPESIRLLAREPARFAGCLSNAVDFLASQQAAQPSEWIDLMQNVSDACESVSIWLAAGKVAAWRSGLVQFRSEALRIAETLPIEVALRAIGIKRDMDDPQWRQVLERLKKDRWYSPFEKDFPAESDSLRIVCTAGGFRGFDGPFVTPPTASVIGGTVFVSDKEHVWELLADSFGTFWRRVSNPIKTTGSTGANEVSISPAGEIVWNGKRQTLSKLCESSSVASDGQTLAITLSNSYYVYLVAPTMAENR